jgi:hypothetical protein
MRIAGFVFVCLLTLAARAQSRTVAITVDDLICASCAPMNPDGTSGRDMMEATNQRLIAGLTQAHWTELVVAHSESRGLLARKEAVAAVTTLLGYRYEVVRITPAIFVEAARRATWDKSAPPFSLALAPLVNLRITENIFAIIGGVASEAMREIEDLKERALVIQGFLETLAARPDGIRVLSMISRAFQNVEVQWRYEWVPIINHV